MHLSFVDASLRRYGESGTGVPHSTTLRVPERLLEVAERHGVRRPRAAFNCQCIEVMRGLIVCADQDAWRNFEHRLAAKEIHQHGHSITRRHDLRDNRF